VLGMPIPPPQVCPLDGFDDDVEAVLGTEQDLWRFVCPHHDPPYFWTVPVSGDDHAGREGVTAELGLYEDLLPCVQDAEPWVEYGIVEYRYMKAHPDIYFGKLMPLYGHRRDGPRHFSLSVLIAKALGQLHREGLLALRAGKATGFWDYNGTISYWATVPPPPDADEQPWSAFAETHMLPPREWKFTLTNLGYPLGDKEGRHPQ
jgi:hypothetical protein